MSPRPLRKKFNFFIKKDDTAPSLSVQLKDNNVAVPLGGATVTFKMINNSNDSVKINNRSATITNASQGRIRVDWQSGDTDTAGRFLGYFTITYGDGTVKTLPGQYAAPFIIDIT